MFHILSLSRINLVFYSVSDIFKTLIDRKSPKIQSFSIFNRNNSPESLKSRVFPLSSNLSLRQTATCLLRPALPGTATKKLQPCPLTTKYPLRVTRVLFSILKTLFSINIMSLTLQWFFFAKGSMPIKQLAGWKYVNTE